MFYRIYYQELNYIKDDMNYMKKDFSEVNYLEADTQEELKENIEKLIKNFIDNNIMDYCKFTTYDLEYILKNKKIYSFERSVINFVTDILEINSINDNINYNDKFDEFYINKIQKVFADKKGKELQQKEKQKREIELKEKSLYLELKKKYE
jgi:hypothetical protein